MNSYDLFARLYHLEHSDVQEDVAFYQNFALRCDGPILELGCGTGRVSLALAQAGFDVTGVDSSSAMLAMARAHAADAGLSAQLRLEQCDVRALLFERRFALAIYPLNGFLHLLTSEDQLSALRNVCRALLPGGLLILDLANPHAVLVSDVDGHLIHRGHFRSPEGRAISSFSCTQTDLATQVQHLTLFYDEVDDDGTVHRTTVETDLRFVYRYEMAGLLRQAGFVVDAVYGTYDLDPYETDSGLMLVVAYKEPSD